LTEVTYSIRFYCTPDFIDDTDDVEGFISRVVTQINQGYENSEVPISDIR
jgi:hypothetical protein